MFGKILDKQSQLQVRFDATLNLLLSENNETS